MTKTTTLCRYWVKKGQEETLRGLLSQHWPIAIDSGFVPKGTPHQVFRGEDKERGVFYVEVFPWSSRESMNAAHSHPEISKIWEAIGESCDSMEFPDVEEIAL